MLYHLIYPLYEQINALNVFRYITFRTALATIISFFIILFLGRPFINLMIKKKKNIIREHTPENHRKKIGTPSMGGILIVFSIVVALGLCGNFSNPNVLVGLICLFIFTGIGYLDDNLKMVKKDGRGISSKTKLLLQLLCGFFIATYLYFFKETGFYFTASPEMGELPYSYLTLPFFSDVVVPLNWLYIPFVMLIFFSTSNAVNITDGLDGLAVSVSLVSIVSFAIIIYISGHKEIAEYLKIPYMNDIGELTVFSGALAGACLGFLWFNSHPAEIFMGDTGSMALGGIIGFLVIILKIEFLFVIIGGVFVIESGSSFLQVYYYKFTKKRLFKMAPLHHHFELMGLKESKIIARFLIVAVICAILGLMSLKLR